jgi:GntR family transcriptional regulator / MocR family aminotransferase
MELILSLERDAAMPLHRQVYGELRQLILMGRLLPGQRVPSTRSLSQSCGISRTTVTQSYEQLLSEGYLETRHGSGTFVCRQLPDTLLHTAAIDPIDTPKPSAIRLSQYAQSMTDNPLVLQTYPTAEISFRYGRPALQYFPITLWRKLLSRHCNANTEWLDYALDAQGDRGLRIAIAHYLARARAVQCDPSQIVLTNGTQQGLDLILRVLTEPGDTIALEDPGYLSARRVFLSHQVNLLPIPVDESGLMVEYLTQLTTAGSPTESLLPVRLLSVTPSHQFPTGATLSLARRLALLQWAQQTGAMIIEDDYDSEYRYGDNPIPALQGLDSRNCVIYMGTFSKVLFPSLRMGYLVLPPQLVTFIAQAKWLSDRQLPMLEQKVLADFIAAGHLESHIRKMRSHYDRRRQVLVQALQHHFGNQITILGEKAGIHVMVRFLLDLSGAEIMARSLQVGVGIVPATPCYLLDGGDREFILGYGELEESVIIEGIKRLAAALFQN